MKTFCRFHMPHHDEEIEDSSITSTPMGEPIFNTCPEPTWHGVNENGALENPDHIQGTPALTLASPPVTEKHLPGDMEHHNAFSDIPNEIFIQIMEYIPDDEQIYKLALVSRRLHHVALPLYLSRKACGIRPSDQLVTANYNARDAFKAIRIAMFRPSLNRLEFAIDCEKTDEELLVQIMELRGALEKLSALQEMVLSFQNTNPCNDILYPSAPSPSPAEYGFPGGLKSASLGTLLDAIHAVGCPSISIRHCGSQRGGQKYIGSSLEQAYGGIRNIPGNIVREVRGILRLSPVVNVKYANITTFLLHSPMAFHPNLLRWTIDTLNYSAINELSISHHQYTDQQSWALIMPHIYLPVLTSLSLDFASIEVLTLSKFLCRHPKIQKLYIGRSFTPLDPNPQPFNDILLNLTHVTASLPWLKCLLSSPTSLPSLIFATALIYIPNDRNVNVVADIDASLKNTIGRFQALKEFRLSITLGALASDWMLPNNNNTYATPIEFAPNGSATSLRQLVTHMDISVKSYILSPALMTRLSGWLIKFPSLRKLELLMLSERVLGSSDAWERTILARAITASCPGIDSVTFGLVKDV